MHSFVYFNDLSPVWLDRFPESKAANIQTTTSSRSHWLPDYSFEVHIRAGLGSNLTSWWFLVRVEFFCRGLAYIYIFLPLLIADLRQKHYCRKLPRSQCYTILPYIAGYNKNCHQEREYKVRRSSKYHSYTTVSPSTTTVITLSTSKMRLSVKLVFIFLGTFSFTSPAPIAGTCDTSTDACVDVLDNSFCQIDAVRAGNKASFLRCFQGGYSSLPATTKVEIPVKRARPINWLCIDMQLYWMCWVSDWCFYCK